MKKFSTFILFCCVFFTFLSCEGLFPNNEKTKTETSAVTQNLSQSKGTNELQDSTFSNENVTMAFAKDSVTYSINSSNVANANSRGSTTNFIPSASFAYSYDSTNKTLEFQLQKVFENGIGTNYNAQVNEAKLQSLSIDNLIVNALTADSLYAGFLNYKDAAKTIVTEKVQKYAATQEALLEDYLTAKYNSVLSFVYDYDNETKLLKINEVFKNNLSDASSKFLYTNEDSVEVVLNDYDHLIPFSVSITSESETIIYIGVPKIEVSSTDSKKGTIKVDLFKYDGQTTAEETSTSFTETVNAIISELKDSAQTILAEFVFSEGKSSETLSDIIDESKIGLISIEFEYEITENSKLNLTPGLVPSVLSSAFTEGVSFTMDYTPVLAFNLELTKSE